MFDVCVLLFEPPSGLTVQSILHLPAHSALRSHITAAEWLAAATSTLGLRSDVGARVFDVFYNLTLKKEVRIDVTRHLLSAIGGNAPSAASSRNVAAAAVNASYLSHASKRVVSTPGLMIFLMAQVFLERPPRHGAGEQHYDQFIAFVKQHIAEIVAAVSVTKSSHVHVSELQELRILFREFCNGSEVPFGTSLTSDLFSGVSGGRTASAQPDGSVDASAVGHYIRSRLFVTSEVRGASTASTSSTHRNLHVNTVFVNHVPPIKPHSELKLQRNSQCTLYVCHPCPNTVLSALTNCVIFLGAVGGVLVLDRCEQCHVIACTSSLVIANCRNVLINVCTNAPPILAGGVSEGTVIGPYNSFYPALEEHLTAAGVNPELNLFDIGLTPSMRQDPAAFVPFVVPVAPNGPAGNAGGLPSSLATRTNPTILPPEYALAVAHRKAKVAELSSLLKDTCKQLESGGRKDLAVGLRCRVQNAFAQWLAQAGQVQGLLDLLHKSSQSTTSVGGSGGLTGTAERTSPLSQPLTSGGGAAGPSGSQLYAAGPASTIGPVGRALRK